ncbi:alpha/beta fold hydrolase [Caulobacter endophyticus]|uniref:Alpha/beta hydrolase n=1 Tax=Caulobacter endophyticus TaxID=2172652 RepID=A0A2T9JI59_9CAUL|nr:alpha/beta hydrolase [Caulobacter endophyticus]PVM83369.1 alpha/beta hydrolase [Caulobacter endophyticus]
MVPNRKDLALLERAGAPLERSYVSVDGAPIAYAQIGSGDEVVVLIHGTLTALDDMMLALGDQLPGRTLIALDRPGFGASHRQVLGQAGILRHANLLDRALVALGVRKAALVGHSFGAAVALAMALAAPDRYTGLLALAPLVLPEWRLEHLLFAPRAVPVLGGWLAGWSHGGFDAALLPMLWRAMFLPQTIPECLEQHFPFAAAGAAAATQRVGEDTLAAGPDLVNLLSRVGSLQAPVTVLGGSHDLVVNNLLHGQLMARLAPRGRFELLPGIGHMVHHVAPQAVARALEDLGR